MSTSDVDHEWQFLSGAMRKGPGIVGVCTRCGTIRWTELPTDPESEATFDLKGDCSPPTRPSVYGTRPDPAI